MATLTPDEPSHMGTRDIPTAWRIEQARKALFGDRVLDPMHLRIIIRDDKPTVLGRCPGCGEWGELDTDQLHGRVSTEHSAGEDDKGHASGSGCGYHQTKDWFDDHTTGGKAW